MSPIWIGKENGVSLVLSRCGWRPHQDNTGGQPKMERRNEQLLILLFIEGKTKGFA